MQKTISLFLLSFFTLGTIHAQNWRVIAIANQWDTTITNINPSFRTIDSTAYIYRSKQRGSNYNSDSVLYDELLFFAVKYDSVAMHKKITRGYNANNDLIVELNYLAENMVVPFLQKTDSFFYNSINKLTSKKIYQPNKTPTGFKTLATRSSDYSYNTLGLQKEEVSKVINDSALELEVTGSNVSHYDAMGDKILVEFYSHNKGIWKNNGQDKLSYNEKGDVIRIEHFIGADTNMVLWSTVFFEYDTKGRLITKTWLPTAAHPSPHALFRDRYAYNDKDQLIRHSFVNLDDSITYVTDSIVSYYQYTPFGYYSQVDKHTYSFSYGLIRRERAKYYYERYAYEETNPIIAWLPREQDLTLYPNPAKNVLNIIWRKEDLTSVKGRIINVQGQVLQQWDETCHVYYGKAIDLGGLSSGNYYIELHTNLGKVHRPFVVAR